MSRHHLINGMNSSEKPTLVDRMTAASYRRGKFHLDLLFQPISSAGGELYLPMAASSTSFVSWGACNSTAMQTHWRRGAHT